MPRGRKQKSRRGGRRGFHGRVSAPQHTRATSPPPVVVEGEVVVEATPVAQNPPLSPREVRETTTTSETPHAPMPRSEKLKQLAKAKRIIRETCPNLEVKFMDNEDQRFEGSSGVGLSVCVKGANRPLTDIECRTLKLITDMLKNELPQDCSSRVRHEANFSVRTEGEGEGCPYAREGSPTEVCDMEFNIIETDYVYEEEFDLQMIMTSLQQIERGNIDYDWGGDSMCKKYGDKWGKRYCFNSLEEMKATIKDMRENIIPARYLKDIEETGVFKVSKWIAGKWLYQMGMIKGTKVETLQRFMKYACGEGNKRKFMGLNTQARNLMIMGTHAGVLMKLERLFGKENSVGRKVRSVGVYLQGEREAECFHSFLGLSIVGDNAKRIGHKGRDYYETYRTFKYLNLNHENADPKEYHLDNPSLEEPRLFNVEMIDGLSFKYRTMPIVNLEGQYSKGVLKWAETQYKNWLKKDNKYKELGAWVVEMPSGVSYAQYCDGIKKSMLNREGKQFRMACIMARSLIEDAWVRHFEPIMREVFDLTPVFYRNWTYEFIKENVNTKKCPCCKDIRNDSASITILRTDSMCIPCRDYNIDL